MEQAQNSGFKTPMKKLNRTSITNFSYKTLCIVFFGSPCISWFIHFIIYLTNLSVAMSFDICFIIFPPTLLVAWCTYPRPIFFASIASNIRWRIFTASKLLLVTKSILVKSVSSNFKNIYILSKDSSVGLFYIVRHQRLLQTEFIIILSLIVLLRGNFLFRSIGDLQTSIKNSKSWQLCFYDLPIKSITGQYSHFLLRGAIQTNWICWEFFPKEGGGGSSQFPKPLF